MNGLRILGTGITTGVLALVGAIVPASAEASSSLCGGYAGCNIAPYTSHGYNTSTNQSSYWGADTGDNCTNYAAYVESHTYGVPSPGNGLGDASMWGTTAPAHGATVDNTPTVGSVAWWNSSAGKGSSGHVAIVESVGRGSVTVSEDAFPASGMSDYSGAEFDWQTYPTSSISGFIHFAGQTLPNPPPSGGTLEQVEHVAGASSWQTYQIRPDLKVAGAPSLVWSTGGSPQLFAVGTDGALRQLGVSNSGWTSSQITPAGSLSTSGGASAAIVNGNTEVFAVSATGTLEQVEHVAGASSWQTYQIRPDLKVAGAPSVVWSTGGSPQLFAVGTDGALRQLGVSNSGWTSSQITPAGSLSTSGGASAAIVNGNTEVFAVSATGTLEQVEHVAGASSWQTYQIRPDLKVAGAPSLVWSTGGSPQLFAVGTDGALRQLGVSNSGWTSSQITPAGSLSTSGGASAAIVNGNTEVFTTAP